MISHTLYFLSEDLDFDESVDALPHDHEQQAFQIAKICGIGITRDRNLTCVVLSDDERTILGAAWTAMDGISYEFDIAVLPDHHGQGIGRVLLDAVVQPPFDMGDAPLDCTQRVVSQRMMLALARRGFEITEIRSTAPNSFDVSMAPRASMKTTLSAIYDAAPDRFVAAAGAMAEPALFHALLHEKPVDHEIARQALSAFLTQWDAAGDLDSEGALHCHLLCIHAIAGELHLTSAPDRKDTHPSGQLSNAPCYTGTPDRLARRI